jgi:hypothetical protein
MRSVFSAMVMVMLSGCTLITPVRPPKFPDVPAELTQPLPDLIPLESSKKKPRELLDNAAENYGICYQYRERAAAWENWYREQKTLYQKHNKQ